MTTRRELIEAVAACYRAAGRNQKREILDEFVKVTGFHRKHAIRALKKSPKAETPEPRHRSRIYDEAVREARTIVWEAADRMWQTPSPSDRWAQVAQRMAGHSNAKTTGRRHDDISVGEVEKIGI